MTRIERKSQQATSKLNKILRLTQEVLSLQEEIAMIENAKDFSKAELIDAKGLWPTTDWRPGKDRKFTLAERESMVIKRNKVLLGPLAHTVKKLKRVPKNIAQQSGTDAKRGW
jgi:hypothetical protein